MCYIDEIEIKIFQTPRSQRPRWERKLNDCEVLYEENPFRSRSIGTRVLLPLLVFPPTAKKLK